MVDRAFSMAESEPGEVSHFDHLLSFPQEIAPVFDSLTAEQEDRRIFDYVRNREVGRNLERVRGGDRRVALHEVVMRIL